MLWPFAINWEQTPLLRLEWLTQVQQAKDDTELVIQLRTGARRTLRFNTIVGTDAERVQYENILISAQGETFQLPWWPHQIWVTAPIAVSDVVLAVTATESKEILPGATVALVNEMRAVLATVDSVTANNVTLTEPVGAWPAGTKVVPVFDARINAQQPITYLTDALLTAEVEFTALHEWIVEHTETADYLGYPVLTQQTEWSNDLTVEVARNIAVFDNQTGVVHYTDISGRSRRTRSHRIIADGATELTAVFNWLAARAGRFKPFWQPTNQNDFLLLQNISNVAVNLVVANWRHAIAYGQPGRMHVMIKLRSGAVFYRRVTAVVAINEHSELITIDAALGVAAAIENVDMMCYLQFTRLSSDAVEVAYETDLAATVALGLTVKREPV